MERTMPGEACCPKEQSPASRNFWVDLRPGDCLTLLPELPDHSIDAVVTDPPYGMNKDFGNDSDTPASALSLLNGLMPHVTRLLRPGGMAFIFGSPRLIHRTIAAGEHAGLQFHRLLWMYKPNHGINLWRGWLMKSEAIAVFSNGRPDRWTLKQYCHDTYTFHHRRQELPPGVAHPSVKPLAVVRDLVSKCPGSVVLDCFMGSGTTGVACVQIGRHFVGMEVNREYFQLAQARIGAEAVMQRNSGTGPPQVLSKQIPLFCG